MRLVGTDRWHIEHIMPQTSIEDLQTEDELSSHEEKVNLIGNLTLLLREDNTGLKNSPYAKKLKIYSLYDGRSTAEEGEDDAVVRPRLKLNLDIASTWPRKWDERAISERGALLGKYATEVWRFNS